MNRICSMFEEIVEGFIRGEKSALSRAISFVERNPEKSYLLISEISKRTGRNLLSEDVHIIGITGPAGIGKSTIISQLIKKTKGGVLLCDPSSVRVEGGAILGDRIRIHAESSTESNGVFIRSVGTRGEFGGISSNTGDIINLFMLFGMKNIIVETAGAGQTETEIHKIADTVVLVVSPESGDEIQFMKSGILEIADIIVLNKADRPDADKLFNEIRVAVDTSHMVLLGIGQNIKWKPPIIKTIAKEGKGIDELIEKIEEHKKFLKENNLILQKRKSRLERDFLSILSKSIIYKLKGTKIYKDELGKILNGEKDPYTSAKEISDIIRKNIIDV